jgi:ubiquinone/menaquinone biosynthesis methyltransferase
MSMGTDVVWRRRAVDGLLPSMPRGIGRRPRILDLCAGTLESSLEIHRRYPDADIVGGDFSAGMLETGASRLPAAARARIEPKAMDAHAIPEDDGSFDALFCAFGVRNLSDLERATAEKARVLRSGGRLRVLEFFRPAHPFPRMFHAFVGKTILPAVGYACTGNIDAYRYLPASIGEFVTTATYAELLQDHGFDAPTMMPLTLGVATVVTATRRGPLESDGKERTG